ncbi:hypothetical protein GCM10025868_15260 [Angustibacter aerolatus]|uniref:Glyoxalase-like domain-containing protein n=1 Tax=Angustibacter aerolatus TaxID=1162965 RepID=A0ABQ6JDL6_9ACTN|nr:hypothetical protein GCM10025868_15260 [Angustibacter aerolatus]
MVHPALDPEVEAAFWHAASGWQRVEGREFPTLRSPDGGPCLEFLPTDEPPEGPRPRLHLDVRPLPGDPQAGEVERLVTLEAQPVDIGQGDVQWVVMTDPEGNAFCVLRTPDA